MKYLELLQKKIQHTMTFSGLTDLLEKIRRNDEATLKALYQEHFKKVEHFVLTNNGSEDEAKDIYQEAFIAVWRNIQMNKFKPENEGSLGGYLFQVARNKWIDHLRSKKNRKTVSLETEQPDIVTAAIPNEDDDHIEMVKKHFNSLGEQCRELLKRFYYDKESMRTIATFFSWTEASAKNNKYRCLQRLRTLVNS